MEGIIIHSLSLAVLLFLLVFLWWQFLFLRDPARKVPAGKNIVAPADGRIIAVLDVDRRKIDLKKGWLGKISTLTSDVGKSCFVISIFMSPFNVHVNRAPLAGKILWAKHTKGRFMPANVIETAFVNEKNEILMQTGIGKVKVIQVAGFIARRIECFVEKNENINKGQRIGRINLGSQVILVIPKKAKIIARTGQRVKAGETVIAEIR